MIKIMISIYLMLCTWGVRGRGMGGRSDSATQDLENRKVNIVRNIAQVTVSSYVKHFTN